MSGPLPQAVLARHGETAWTISGQHTGRTDIPLTERGERESHRSIWRNAWWRLPSFASHGEEYDGDDLQGWRDWRAGFRCLIAAPRSMPPLLQTSLQGAANQVKP